MSPLETSSGMTMVTPQAGFVTRHIGLNDSDIATMLATLDLPSVEALLGEVIPPSILRSDKMDVGAPLSESEILDELGALAAKNTINQSLIGMGYYGCHTPPVILRNVLENPGWYTAYTPYQPEISQGRLEAILNYQTMVAELTGMDIANGSLLDEATAAAEGMAMAFRAHRGKADIFRVDPDTHPQTLSILRTRAQPLGITLDVKDPADPYQDSVFGVLISYPGSSGAVREIQPAIEAVHTAGGLAAYARAHRSIFVAIFSRGTLLPTAVLLTIVEYWAHLGWYQYRVPAAGAGAGLEDGLDDDNEDVLASSSDDESTTVP